MSFGSNGPHVPYDQRDIFSNFSAAARYLGDEDSIRFGRQEGWIEWLDRGDGARYSQQRHGQAIGIRYHETHVIVLYPNGDTAFDTGGWDTFSTAQWMGANDHCTVDIYAPRKGDRKPYRYSTIQWTKGNSYRWRRSEGDPPERPTYVFKDHIRFSKRGRCLTPDARLLADAIAEEKAVRAKQAAYRRKMHGRIRAYTNRTMKALAEGLPFTDDELWDADVKAIVERAEPHAALTMRIVSALPGDVRYWLNLHEHDDEIVMGKLPPVVETIVRRKIGDELKRLLVTNTQL